MTGRATSNHGPTTVEEKALELVEENRVVVIGPAETIVAGYTNHYDVLFHKQGAECNCKARVELCAHILASMVAFEDRAEELKPPW